MKFTDIGSYKDLSKKLSKDGTSYVLIYKEGSELSRCALQNLNEATAQDIEVLKVDVSKVKDIHTKYGITSAPTMLLFENGVLSNVIKGCHDKAYFTQMFENLVYSSIAEGGKPSKSVTVYTTPTCSWCGTLKTYLRKNNVRYREVNIARDPALAEELVRKSGQQGVPQTEINGQIVVGFDKAKLNRLLEIENQS